MFIETADWKDPGEIGLGAEEIEWPMSTPLRLRKGRAEFSFRNRSEL